MDDFYLASFTLMDTFLLFTVNLLVSEIFLFLFTDKDLSTAMHFSLAELHSVTSPSVLHSLTSATSLPDTSQLSVVTEIKFFIGSLVFATII